MPRNEFKFLSLAVVGEGDYPDVIVSVNGHVYKMPVYESLKHLLEIVEKHNDYPGNGAMGSVNVAQVEPEPVFAPLGGNVDDEIPF